MQKLTRVLTICLLTTAFSVIIGSCSKKTEEIAKTVLLTTSTWKYSEAGIDYEADGKIDEVPSFLKDYLKPCFTDFILTFKSDKTGTFDEGASKCDPLLPQSSPIVWDITADNKELTLPANLFPQLPGFGGSIKIIELSATRLVLNKNVSIPGFPVAIPATIVLVH